MSLGTQRHGDEDAEREVVEGVPHGGSVDPRGCVMRHAARRDECVECLGSCMGTLANYVS